MPRKASGDRGAAVRPAAVADLAEHFGDDERFTLLVGLARKDPAAGVCLAAAAALAEHFGADARTRGLIIARATDERDAVVRLAAPRVPCTARNPCHGADVRFVRG